MRTVLPLLSAVCLCVAGAAAQASPLEGPAEVRYRGSLSPAGRDGTGAPVKKFDVYSLVHPEATGGFTVTFLVDERGSGAWPWPERFGRLSLDASRQSGNAGVRVLHEFGDKLWPITVPGPLFADFEKLSDGATWTSGRFASEVTGSSKVGGRTCWVVEISNNFGPQRTEWVEKTSGLVVRSRSRVVVGRGDRFQLDLELVSREPVAEDRLLRLDGASEKLIGLQQSLGRKSDTTDPELSRKQLDQVAAAVDAIQTATGETPFARLASVIRRDLQSQMRRFDDVATLQKRFLDRPAPKFQLTTFAGTPVSPEEYSGKIVVLHFWKYNGEQLAEPYGQVGYLDFLHSRRRKLGVQIYGVAVNQQLARPETRAVALRSIRKLRDFMNLDYPVTLDDGTLLKKFGDPQEVGAKLPLWVVIDPAGKVVHWNAGNYRINPDQGLKELDNLLVELIRAARESGAE